MASSFKPGAGQASPGSGSARSTPRNRAEPCAMQRSDSSRSVQSIGATNEQKHRDRDNIKVSVRIRPLSEKERGRGDKAVWATDGSGGVGTTNSSSGRLDVKYAYDIVFDASTANEQVFETVGRSTIEPVISGVSGTIFAYGVTSSGKTHTMMGTAADPGLVPRAIQALFEHIGQATDRVFTVTMSMMEIYCEMLNDLLDPTKMNLDVQERELPNGRGAVLQVKHLTEGKVASAAAALALIQQGQDNRKVGATAYNDQSSRSHTLCRFLVESAPAAAVGSSGSSSSSSAVTRTSAWLTLVDLAGSEGAKAALSKDQQAEARDINRSLLTLGKVVFELARGSAGGHVPYRDSLLTRLLKPSLTGSGAKVAIICNVTPASSQSEETWNTLRFADGAKRIKVAAVKNEALDVAAVVAQYQKEVATLKAQLAALSGAAAAGASLSPEALQALHDSMSASNTANRADQLADTEAQLRYLEENNVMLAMERDQLLTMNRRMMAMLVQQLQAGLQGNSSSDKDSSNSSSTGGINPAVFRRCLSCESMPCYSSWQSSQSQPHWQPGAHTGYWAGSRYSSLTAAAVEHTGPPLMRVFQEGDAERTTPAGTGAAAAAAAVTAAAADTAAIPLKAAAAAAMAVGPAVSAVLPTLPTQAVQLAVQAAPSAEAIPAVVPGSIYFPGSRRLSKTLAAMLLHGTAASATGSVSEPALGAIASCADAAAAWCSAGSEVVQLHKKVVDQQACLDLLTHQLEDKEILLAQARQMQEGQALQLRLTITAADRALLRDKLSEAEQQLATYQDTLQKYAAEKNELYDTAYSLYNKVIKISEQYQAAKSELKLLKSQVNSTHGSAASRAAAAGGAGGTKGSAAGAAATAADYFEDGSSGDLSSSNSSSHVLSELSKRGIPTMSLPAAGGAAAAGSAPRSPTSAKAGRQAAQSFGSKAELLNAVRSPRQLSSIPSVGHSSSANSSTSTAAGGATAGPRALPSQPILSNGYVGISNLNPICITSPFSSAAAAVGQQGSMLNPEMSESAYGTSNATGGNNSASSSCTNSIACSTLVTTASMSSIIAGLPTGSSRIPLPPCLQQRPQGTVRDGDSSSAAAATAGLFRYGTVKSRLPTVPLTGNSGNSNGVATAVPNSELYTVSVSTDNSSSFSSRIGGGHKRQPSQSNPLVAPAERQMSRPGLLALAAFAEHKGASGMPTGPASGGVADLQGLLGSKPAQHKPLAECTTTDVVDSIGAGK